MIAIYLLTKNTFARRYIAIVTEDDNDESFGRELAEMLSPATSSSEKELVINTDRVININRRFSDNQQRIVDHCVSTMSRGMIEFQGNATIEGLKNLHEFDRYCYRLQVMLVNL